MNADVRQYPSSYIMARIGGKLFSQGYYYKLLINLVNVRKIKHKDEVYKSQHIRIVN